MSEATLQEDCAECQETVSTMMGEPRVEVNLFSRDSYVTMQFCDPTCLQAHIQDHGDFNV